MIGPGLPTDLGLLGLGATPSYIDLERMGLGIGNVNVGPTAVNAAMGPPTIAPAQAPAPAPVVQFDQPAQPVAAGPQQPVAGGGVMVPIAMQPAAQPIQVAPTTVGGGGPEPVLSQGPDGQTVGAGGQPVLNLQAATTAGSPTVERAPEQAIGPPRTQFQPGMAEPALRQAIGPQEATAGAQPSFQPTGGTAAEQGFGEGGGLIQLLRRLAAFSAPQTGGGDLFPGVLGLERNPLATNVGPQGPQALATSTAVPLQQEALARGAGEGETQGQGGAGIGAAQSGQDALAPMLGLLLLAALAQKGGGELGLGATQPGV